MSKVVVRPVDPKDKDFIFATWLRGQYWGSQYYMRMEQDEYFQDYADRLRDIICTPGTLIDCAVLEDDLDFILGFIVYNDQHLYWGYVKHDYRKQGVLSTLLKNMDFNTYSGDTRVGHAVGKKLELRFNPLKEVKK